MAAVIELVLTLLQTLAVAGEHTHAGGNHLLSLVTAHRIEGFGHQVVERAGNLVHHHRGKRSPVEEPLGLELVDHRHTGHHAGAVGDGETLTDVDAERFEAVLTEHFRRRAPFAVVVHTPLAYHRQCEVRQLHKVAAGPHAAMLRNHREDVAVDHLHQQFHQVRVHA